MTRLTLPEEPWKPAEGDRFGLYVKRVRDWVTTWELVYSHKTKHWCIVKSRAFKRCGWSVTWRALKLGAPK